MEENKIYNMDSFDYMKGLDDSVIDVVLTSPPYNTGGGGTSEKARENHESRYDVFMDNKTDEEYLEWSVELFELLDKAIKPNGVVLYNISYSSDKPDLMWLVIAEIMRKTNWMTADTVVWKKNSALPNNMSTNKLTRIVEFVFVFCRKEEIGTFHTNKKIVSESENGQNRYNNVFNFITAKNNDRSTKLNKATYSTELCEKLLKIYARDSSLVYDPFMGTGTTAVASKRLGHRYLGSELSEEQCKYAEKRLMFKVTDNSKIKGLW